MQRSLFAALTIMAILPFASTSKAIESGRSEKDVRTDSRVEQRNMNETVTRRNDNDYTRREQEAEELAVIRDSRTMGPLSSAAEKEINRIVMSHQTGPNLFAYSPEMKLSRKYDPETYLAQRTVLKWSIANIPETTYLSMLQSGTYRPLGREFVYQGHPFKFGYFDMNPKHVEMDVGVADTHGGTDLWAWAGTWDGEPEFEKYIKLAQLWTNDSQILLRVGDGRDAGYYIVTGKVKKNLGR